MIALLDQEKPDPDTAAALAADADRIVAPELADADRGEAYFNRAQARARLGRINDAIADTREAVKRYAHPLFWAPYSVIGDGGGT